MGKQEYLSAGRFAALVGTTKETLFHYDEIGLFVPKRRGTNGYRYYAMDQIETFDVIGMRGSWACRWQRFEIIWNREVLKNSEYCWNRREGGARKNAAAPRDAALDWGKEAVSGTGIGGMP